MQDNEMCGESYTRPLKLFPSDGIVPRIPCTFIKDHGANHSWFALKIADDVELDRLREQQQQREERVLPTHVQQVVNAIEDGTLDPYLELVLAYGHDRKRTLRGVPGFARRVG